MANLVPKLSHCPVLHIVNYQKWTLKGLGRRMVCRWEASLVGTNRSRLRRRVRADQPCWWWLSGFTWLMYTQVSFLPVVPCGGWYSSGGHRPHGVSDEAGEGSRWNLCWYWRSWPADTGDQGLHTAVFHERIWYCDHIAVFKAPYCWMSVKGMAGLIRALWIFTHLCSMYEPRPSQKFSDTMLQTRQCDWIPNRIIFDFYTEIRGKKVLCHQLEIGCWHFAERKLEQISSL